MRASIRLDGPIEKEGGEATTRRFNRRIFFFQFDREERVLAGLLEETCERTRLCSIDDENVRFL